MRWSMTEPVHDPNVAKGDGDRGATLRRRLILVVSLEYVALMGIAAIEGFWPGQGPGQAAATGFLVAAMVLLPLAMAVLIRPLLRDIRRLDSENDRLREQYSKARLDSLIDGLTGLGNHRAFQEELARQLEHAGRTNSKLALMLVDVDDLKKINDERGHATGDRLLAAVGWTVMALLRRNDRAFRVGGDEFAIILPGADIETGVSVGRRMLASALNGGDPSRPIESFSLSIGVSAVPTPSTVAGSLLYRHADAALYWCKRHGRTNVVAFDPGLHGSDTGPEQPREITEAIERIIAERLLRPVYQPIFSIVTGEAIGFEGLIRPAEGAPIGDPSSLFTAAEKAGRTVELDMACLEVIAEGASDLAPGAYLSVNLSPRSLESSQFHPSDLTKIFNERGIATDRLVVEMTEREQVEDLATLRRNAAACRKTGIRLAADDVGAGNAGLRLLSEIHFDIVKIDLSLVQGGVLHDPSHAVLRALKELAARWSATIVAEGVETSTQLAVIRDLGITAGQGYLLGRPTPERNAERLDIASMMPTDWVPIDWLERSRSSAA